MSSRSLLFLLALSGCVFDHSGLSPGSAAERGSEIDLLVADGLGVDGNTVDLVADGSIKDRLSLDGESGPGDLPVVPDVTPDVTLPDVTTPDVTTPDTGPPPPWWNTAWARRRRLTFKNAASKSDLLEFPVLVVLSKARITFGQTKAAGEDIRFVDADDKTVLSHEIEAWGPGSSAAIWVRVPKIDKASTTDFIWLYHGNPAAKDGQDPPKVWHKSYKAVWHLHDDFEDSTSNKRHAVNHGSTDAAGRIGDGQAFSGQGQYIDTKDKRDLASFTVTAWVRGETVPNSSGINGPLMREENYQLCWDHISGAARAAASYDHPSGNWRTASFGSLAAKTWTLLAATYEKGTLTAYVDGKATASDKQKASAPSPCQHSTKIGRHAVSNGGSNFFEGRVDEVRIADVARSADWIAAQHASMTDAFIDYGNEEKAP